ncbi:glycosyltransferase [Uliginosibacterium paludis]|uniref:Glycosyltransferase n=1 Tax=Uliginosibacterium paludis TaxID=1615952 RepID=A0ABV2CJZ5_9RHOO
MRILYVTTGLGVGGAERALERLLPALAARGFTLAVVSLREPQPVGARLRELGIEVHELGMRPSRPSLAGLIRLWRVVRRFRPDVLQGWMYHGNLAAQLARLAAPRAKVLLSIHQTLARLELESLATRTVIRLDAWLSRFAASVLYVAQAAVAQHEAAGYARRALVLPNPLDTGVFRPDAQARAAVRQALGIGEAQFVMTLLGRFHPAKNHEGFLRAAACVAAERPEVVFLMAGLEVESANPTLAPLLAAPALQGRVRALGPRDDVPQLLAASDLLVLSSIQEALPNVVMEAMSCAVPCVVTDVGDAARMIGDTGWLVAPGDEAALAEAMVLALDEPATSLAQRAAAARNRAVTHFGLDAVTARHAALYRSLA